MNKYLDYLKNPLIGGGVAGFLIVTFAYIDQKMNERDFENNYFIKLFVCVYVLVAGLIYLASSGTSTIKQTGGSSVTVRKLGEVSRGLDVYTDAPDF